MLQPDVPGLFHTPPVHLEDVHICPVRHLLYLSISVDVYVYLIELVCSYLYGFMCAFRLMKSLYGETSHVLNTSIVEICHQSRLGDIDRRIVIK